MAAVRRKTDQLMDQDMPKDVNELVTLAVH